MIDTSDTDRPSAAASGGAGVSGPAPIPHGLERARLAAIVENSDDAIVSKDLQGVVTSWNRAAERLFGYAAPEIVGRNIAVLAPPGRENEMPMILERIRTGERVDHFGVAGPVDEDARLRGAGLAVVEERRPVEGGNPTNAPPFCSHMRRINSA